MEKVTIDYKGWEAIGFSNSFMDTILRKILRRDKAGRLSFCKQPTSGFFYAHILYDKKNNKKFCLNQEEYEVLKKKNILKPKEGRTIRRGFKKRVLGYRKNLLMNGSCKENEIPVEAPPKEETSPVSLLEKKKQELQEKIKKIDSAIEALRELEI